MATTRIYTYCHTFSLPDALPISLFGRNTTGGAILVTTADPSPVTSAKVKLGYERFNAPTVQAYATTGVGDNLAFDIEGLYRRGDGYFPDVTSGDANEIGRECRRDRDCEYV